MNHKIIIVDDEKDISDDLKTYLEYKGFSTLSAWESEQGLQLIESEKPSLVILDINMPQMNGVEILRRVRITNPELPVVITTGEHVQDVERKLAGISGWAYLGKPIELAELDRLVSELLSER